MSRLNLGLRAFALCAVSVSALSLAAASASAQYYPVQPAYPPPPPGYGSIPLQEADAVVRSIGLTPITRPRRHGPFFIVVQAMGQEGTPVQVTLDRRSGRVIQIVRLGPSGPRIARVQPGAPPLYEPGGRDPEPEAEYYEEGDDDLAPLPPGSVPGPRGSYSSPPGSAPNVITREGIQPRNLPPGSGPQVVTRDPEITGSVPRDSSAARSAPGDPSYSSRSAPREPYSSRSTPPASASGRVDPLLGVPPEFRGQQSGEPARVAARPPAEAIPRVTPLPRPRPADAPALAKTETPPPPAPAPAAKPETAPAVKPETTEATPPASKSGPTDWPPVQGLE